MLNIPIVLKPLAYIIHDDYSMVIVKESRQIGDIFGSITHTLYAMVLTETKRMFSGFPENYLQS